MYRGTKMQWHHLEDVKKDEQSVILIDWQDTDMMAELVSSLTYHGVTFTASLERGENYMVRIVGIKPRNRG
tara:strand:+ start:116 stop:328 length:213 start_codon:yes stop_codon:yes gene_type:complete